jgi:hypothetical protein
VPPHRRVLRVRARAYQATVQFPKEVVRSDRCARAAARAVHGNKFSSFYFLICMLGDDPGLVIRIRIRTRAARSAVRQF